MAGQTIGFQVGYLSSHTKCAHRISVEISGKMQKRREALGLRERNLHVIPMKTRIFAIMLALCPLPSWAEGLSVDEISAYLNSFKTAQARFTQINGDGSLAFGDLALRRPGRARFDYDHDDTLVLVGGGQVAVFDPVSRRRPEQYPLRRTPLAHVLARNVDLKRSGMLVAHRSDDQMTSITLQDPDEPRVGTITLNFSSDPVSLESWLIVNEFGERTSVILEDLTTGVNFGARTFNIPQEISDRGLN